MPRVIVTDRLRRYRVAQRHLFPDSSTDKVAASTIVLRTRIDPHADENDRCNAQVLRAAQNFLPATRRPATSIHADASWRT